MGLVHARNGPIVTEPDAYTYPRYLKAKKTVDARALNRRVWRRFLNHLTDGSTAPLRILEVGGGVGATVERLVDALESRSVDRLHYTFVDVTPENVAAAREELRAWAQDRGYQVTGKARQVWAGGPLEVSVRYVAGDLFEIASSFRGNLFNAVIAQAVLDIVDLAKARRALHPLLTESGLWYLPIHFDGLTAFEPTRTIDSRIERLYHASMTKELEEGRRRTGVRCGRRLLNAFQQSNEILLEAGASDWVVHPMEDGYRADEAYFLHHILHFIETELEGHPELNETTFSGWIEERRQQINGGVLIYIAHQLDVLAQAP
jgi:hypothetical protein